MDLHARPSKGLAGQGAESLLINRWKIKAKSQKHDKYASLVKYDIL